MPTCGFASLSPSFPSSRETTLMVPRPASPRSSFVALLGLGGTTSVPCYPLIVKCLGRNSRLLSEGTISQLEFLIASLMNFWHSIKEPAWYCSTLRPSMTCASMQDIMLILTRRKETSSAGVSTPNCENVSTLFGLIASMSWTTWPSPRRIVL
jgi:hypothetical protein